MKTTLFHPQLLRVGAAAALALSLSACATFGGGTPEEIVAKRSQAYWDARIKGDVAKTRSFTNEAFRKTVDEKKFARNHMGTFVQSAAVHSVKCEPEKCDVRLNLKASPPIPGVKMGTITTEGAQTWLLEDGQWNLYIEP